MKTATVSVHKATKRTSISHNNRDLDEEKLADKYHDHIDPSRIKDNITFVKQDIHDTYDELFGDAVLKYNAKQKRADRKIDDYYAKVKQDGNLEPQREFIVQVGDVNQFRTENSAGESTGLDALDTERNWVQAKAALELYMQSFSERNPHLHVYNAVMHLDEASPHLHINVVPVASDYKIGMSLRPSFNKALEQQGFARSDPKTANRDQFTQWHQSEEQALMQAMEQVNVQREDRSAEPQHSYLPPAAYKEQAHRQEAVAAAEKQTQREAEESLALMSENAGLKAENRELTQENKDLRTEVHALREQNSRLQLAVDSAQRVAREVIGWVDQMQTTTRNFWNKTKADFSEVSKKAIQQLFPKRDNHKIVLAREPDGLPSGIRQFTAGRVRDDEFMRTLTDDPELFRNIPSTLTQEERQEERQEEQHEAEERERQREEQEYWDQLEQEGRLVSETHVDVPESSQERSERRNVEKHDNELGTSQKAPEAAEWDAVAKRKALAAKRRRMRGLER